MFLLLVFLVSVLPLSTDGGKIFWGTEAKPHSWPYMAFIEYYDSNSYIRRCGGCLVEKDIVMTAAHCLGRKMRVTLGVHNIMENKNIQVIPIQKAKRHEAFDSTTLANDIMLLKLERKAQNNSFVKTIALPKSQDWVKPGQVCTVAGWGELCNCVLPNTLREVSLEVQNSQKCQEMFNGYNNFTQICVGNPKEKKATGEEDSGGPFVCDNVAQGIVSRHHCTGEIPQVFTRVSSFIPWIKKTIKLLQKP